MGEQLALRAVAIQDIANRYMELAQRQKAAKAGRKLLKSDSQRAYDDSRIQWDRVRLRHLHLARAFLQGRPRSSVEQKTMPEPSYVDPWHARQIQRYLYIYAGVIASGPEVIAWWRGEGKLKYLRASRQSLTADRKDSWSRSALV